MIVKDESKVICRALASAKPIIDHWVIVDTGSTDGTQDVIRKFMSDVPGELHERPWVNFGHNRQEALELAKGKADYVLILDADDWFEFTGKPHLPDLTEDLYYIWRGKETQWRMEQLVKSHLPWKWKGVAHEVISIDQPVSSAELTNIRYCIGRDGNRSEGIGKFLEYIELFSSELEKNPGDTRSAFYLAQSYYSAGQLENALKWYEKRIELAGWQEEVFLSMMKIAHILQHIGTQDEVLVAYQRAHRYRPHRCEPLYYMAEIYRNNGEYQLAYECVKICDYLPEDHDINFHDSWIEDYGLLFELSICSYWLGHYEESLKACDELLKNPNLPQAHRERTELNRAFPLAKIEERGRKKKPLFALL